MKRLLRKASSAAVHSSRLQVRSGIGALGEGVLHRLHPELPHPLHQDPQQQVNPFAFWDSDSASSPHTPTVSAAPHIPQPTLPELLGTVLPAAPVLPWVAAAWSQQELEGTWPLEPH